MNLDDVNVGGQLQVGSGIPPAVGQGDKRINGSAYVEGPVVAGGPLEFGWNSATVMIGRTKNNDEDCEETFRSLHLKGNQFIEGDGDGGPATLYIRSSIGDAININNNTLIDDSGDAIFAIGTGGEKLSTRFNQADDRPKPFDLKHPSREGWRLRHACIEGPEVAVYCRGRVRNEKVIGLPPYWKDLVHTDSISVQLQPIGAHQDIIVKRWDDEFIHLQAQGGLPINCFYHVYAERKDINPLIVEYEGDKWQDYPDPNYQPTETNPNFNDERYRGDRNTITG